MDRWRVSLFGDRLHVITDDDAETGKRKAIGLLEQAAVEVKSVHERPYSLEDVFIAVVQKAQAEGKSTEEE